MEVCTWGKSDHQGNCDKEKIKVKQNEYCKEIQIRWWSYWDYRETYTRIPVTVEAINVPTMANVTIAPKFEKKGFCRLQ